MRQFYRLLRFKIKAGTQIFNWEFIGSYEIAANMQYITGFGGLNLNFDAGLDPE